MHVLSGHRRSPERASHGGASERIKTGYRETGNPSEHCASLELSQLTEKILPPNELLQILENSQDIGLFSPGLAWYYQHVSLVP